MRSSMFLGDYVFSNLYQVGIPDLNLTKVNKQDISINVPTKERKEVAGLFNELQSQVILPTNNYISAQPKSVYSTDGSEYKIRYLYWNNNSDDLGIFVDYDKGYSSSDRPRLIILPQFKNNLLIVEKLL